MGYLFCLDCFLHLPPTLLDRAHGSSLPPLPNTLNIYDAQLCTPQRHTKEYYYCVRGACNSQGPSAGVLASFGAGEGICHQRGSCLAENLNTKAARAIDDDVGRLGKVRMLSVKISASPWTVRRDPCHTTYKVRLWRSG